MSDYRHLRTFEVRYSDADFKDDVKLSALLSFVQEAACSSADELGFGYEALKPRGLGFLVVGTQCEFYAPVRLGEAITVATWPCPPRHAFFERDYLVTDRDGNKLCALASRWCLFDFASGTLRSEDALPEHEQNCYNPEKSIAVSSWRLPKIGEDGEEVYRMKICGSHCDHYLHANNARYADFFSDCFTMRELSERRVRRFAITYIRQAKEGEEIVFVRKDCGNGIYLAEARHDGETIAQFSMETEEERRTS